MLALREHLLVHAPARSDLQRFAELYTEAWRKRSTSKQKVEYHQKVSEDDLSPSW
jgi:hypothetical protein